MSRIGAKFDELRSRGEKALITFVTAGDPTLEATRDLVLEMEKRGADIIELGIPYSDPVAEGPVIMRANSRALKNKIRIKDIMGLVSDIRKTSEIPLVYLLYFNCILRYGPERFFSDCKSGGVDGIIVPDLPYEECDEIYGIAKDYGIDLIMLVAPTSRERIEKIAGKAGGFLYCVSSLGVTGVREKFSTDFKSFFECINRYSAVPKALGFGISTPAQAEELGKYCDGIIVGSAIVKRVEEGLAAGDFQARVGGLVAGLKSALEKVR